MQKSIERVSQKTRGVTEAYVAWAIVALFYCYQYILRVSPSVMVTDLRQDFRMTAEEFSSLGAIYLYAYSLLQIPLGFLIDRVGVRKTVLWSIGLACVGALTLAWAQSLAMVQISRFLVGAGSACAFMSALKIAADYLPAGQRGLLMGATLALGTVGALTAGKPLVHFIEVNGWRSTAICTGFIGVGLLVFAWLFLRFSARPTDNQTKASLRRTVPAIKALFKNRRVMTYAILAIGLYTPLSVLADLWGTAFLMQKFELSRAHAAQTSMMMYVGLSMGSLVLPWACEKWNILDSAIKVCGVGILICFSLILFGPMMDVVSLSALLIVLGIFCGAEMICFTGAVQFTHNGNSGLTIGVVNTLNMMGGAILQQAIGFVLDRLWTNTLDEHGIRQYQSHEFIMALSLLLVVIIGCVLISLRLGKRNAVVGSES